MENQQRKAVSTVRAKAGEVADDVQQTVGDQANRQIDAAAGRLDEVADVLHETGGKFRDRQQGLIAEQVETLAGKTQELSSYLRTHSFEQVMGDVESYARRNPALVVGAAAVAGFVGARMLRTVQSASPRETRQGMSTVSGTTPTREARYAPAGAGPERPPHATQHVGTGSEAI